jgi:hypothetical protein
MDWVLVKKAAHSPVTAMNLAGFDPETVGKALAI